jgi:hypothetical protein
MAARSGRDFVTTGASPLAAGGKRLAVGLRAAFLFMVRHPATVLGGVLLLAALAAVALNALAWQTARHKHPLFPRKSEPAERRVAALPAPLPPARPAEVRAPAPAALPATLNAPAGPVPPTAVTPPARPAPARDPIGDLIRGGDSGSAAAKEPSPRIMAAQKALTKLGYATLKSDGVMGPGTRQAIEKFEKDRKLAVTGDLNARTTRELAAQARMAIE